LTLFVVRVVRVLLPFTEPRDVFAFRLLAGFAFFVRVTRFVLGEADFDRAGFERLA
jgi:hypothetical protein